MPANDAIPDIAATALPPVRMSMHMWDPDPARRFVILDGQRMGEGDRSGGLTVLTIDRTGVVIERDGQRARIPLP
jgi:general secretion pathway protein B